MDRKTLKKVSRQQLGENSSWIRIILAMFFVGLFLSIPDVLLPLIDPNIIAKFTSIAYIQYIAWAVSAIIYFIFFLLAFGLDVGLKSFALEVAFDRKPTYKSVFKRMNNCGEVIKANIIIAILVTLGLIAFIVPGIILALKYGMINYYFAENPNATSKDARKAIAKIMKGHKAEYFRFIFSFFWWGLLVLVTGGLAGLYVTPYYAIAEAHFFQKVKADKKVADKKVSE